MSIISCKDSEHIEDFVILGGGLMGSSTAWELSKYGQNVLLIEQQDSIYTFGSSFGEARISRSLGPKGDIFSYLQQTSVSETKHLIEFLNEGETKEFHSMEDIYSTSPVTYFYHKLQLSEVEHLLDGQTDTCVYAPNVEKAFENFGMTVSDTSLVLREYKQYSGTLNPKILIQKLHKGIQKAGNRIHYNQKVIHLKKVNDIYEIKLEDTKTDQVQVVLSKKVVAAAGPYNGLVVKDVAPYFKDLITPKRLFLSFLSINSNTYDNLTIEQKQKLQVSYPMVYLNSEIFYSMIEKYDEADRPLLKVGGHLLRTDIKDLDSVWTLELTPKEIEWSKKNTIDYLAKLNLPIEIDDLEFTRGYSCVYSLTSSEIPYVTNAIKNGTEVDSSFVLVGGMSGIGAKGSLTYGLIAADLLLGKRNNSEMYQKTKVALGSERLMKDILNISK